MSDQPSTEKPKWVKDEESEILERAKRQMQETVARESNERLSRMVGREPQPAWPPGSPVGRAIEPMKLPTVGEMLARHIMSVIAKDSGLPSLRVYEEVTRACVAAFQRTDELIAHYQRLEVERMMRDPRAVIWDRQQLAGHCRCGSPTQFDQINLKWLCVDCKEPIADCECQRKGL